MKLSARKKSSLFRRPPSPSIEPSANSSMPRKLTKAAHHRRRNVLTKRIKFLAISFVGLSIWIYTCWRAVTRAVRKEPFAQRIYLNEEYTDPEIVSDGCELTILFSDPNIHSSEKARLALESVATNVPRKGTCILLQTSLCNLSEDEQPSSSLNHLYRTLQSHLGPKFQSFILNGHVRVSVLNHTKYRLSSCKKFYPLAAAFFNIHYWSDDEFTPMDSDLILTIQSDSVLCRPFLVSSWSDLAYVGAPWPPHPDIHKNPHPKRGVCNWFTDAWAQWTRNQTSFPPVCTSKRYGPVGNGGFSLRSRSWLRKAISTCPHPQYSGVSPDAFRRAALRCNVSSIEGTKEIAEDLYFATVLRGIGAPMANAFEASLFGAEMVFPEHVRYYFEYSKEEVGEWMEKRWKKVVELNELETRNEKGGWVGTKYTVPIGVHKVYDYHSLEFIFGNDLRKQCPYLEGIVPRVLKERWKKQQQEIAEKK